MTLNIYLQAGTHTDPQQVYRGREVHLSSSVLVQQCQITMLKQLGENFVLKILNSVLNKAVMIATTMDT